MKRQTLTIAAAVCAAFYATIAAAHEFRPALTLDDARAAACRISTPTARGTGTFNGVDKTNGWAVISTNYHVITTNSVVTLDFWTNSVQQTIKGTVYARYYDASLPVDAALIKVDPDELAKIDPPFVPLAGRGAAPGPDSYILSAGCPKGRFVNAWRGKVLGYYAGRTVEFQPPPVPGQSGSAIVSFIDGKLWQTGILTWLIGPEGVDSSKGGAIPIANLYEARDRQRAATPTGAGTGGAASPIPPGATECADTAAGVYVIEITRDNCPACRAAEIDAQKLVSAGVSLRTVNASTPAGADYARRFNATAAPTWLIFDAGEHERARHVGAGRAAAILRDVAAIADAPVVDDPAPEPSAQEPTPPAQTPPPADVPKPADDPTPPPVDDLVKSFCPLILDTAPGDASQDFRRRAPVYDDDLTLVDFFADSDAAWRARRDKATPPADADKTAPEPPKTPTTPRAGLRGALSADALVDRAVDRLTANIDAAVDARKTEIKGTVQSFWRAVKWRVITGCITLGVVMLIIVQILAAGVRWLMRRARKAWRLMIAQAAAQTSVKKE